MADPEGWMDLGDCLKGGYNVVWCCSSCYVGAEVPAEKLIARHGAARTIQALEREARCKTPGCGSGGRLFPRAKVMARPTGATPDGNVNFSTPASGAPR